MYIVRRLSGRTGVRLQRFGFTLLLAASLAACGESETEGARAPAGHAQMGAPQQQQETAQYPEPQPQQQLQPRGLPRGAIHVERAVILDATGFEQPMAAATLFLPAGWRSEGGVLWDQQFTCVNGFNYSWSAFSPDGAQSIAIIPQEKWESNNYNAAPSTPGCQPAPYTNVRQYLEAQLQRFRSGARVLDFRQRPDLAQEYARFNSQTPTAMGEMRTWVEAGEIMAAFDDNGRDMRGTMGAVVVFNLMHTNPVAGMGAMDALTGYAFPGFAASAPNGQYNFAFFEALRKSIKVNPQWEARIGNHNAAIGRVAIEESRKRAAMIAETNEYISRIREEAWQASQDSADRRAREFGELMKGVETYSDANAAGGQVELSNNYNNAWRLQDGSYVLTNDPNFEPWRDLQIEGQRLDAVQ
jgi:hypothetical protein